MNQTNSSNTDRNGARRIRNFEPAANCCMKTEHPAQALRTLDGELRALVLKKRKGDCVESDFHALLARRCHLLRCIETDDLMAYEKQWFDKTSKTRKASAVDALGAALRKQRGVVSVVDLIEELCVQMCLPHTIQPIAYVGQIARGLERTAAQQRMWRRALRAAS